MSKTPPGVKRLVSVLNFFAEHPGQAFNFTDIVKALKLGRATCHALLAGLVEEQYLYRNADKSYVIGPALVAVGKMAGEQFSPLQAAQPEMRALSDECNAICSAVFREGREVVIQSRAGSGSQLSWSVPQGSRLPLGAPFAGPFFATSSISDLDRWLDELDPPVPQQDKEELFAGIRFTRQHGFMFGVFNEAVTVDRRAVEQAFSGKQEAYPATVVTELDPNAEYRLAFLIAPVIDERGDVAFVLNLAGFSGTVKGEQVAEMGKLLRGAAERVTYFINGKRQPYPFPE